MTDLIWIGNQVFSPHWITNVTVDEERKEAVLYMRVSISRTDMAQNALKGLKPIGPSYYEVAAYKLIAQCLLREQAWIKFVGKDYETFLEWLKQNSERL